MRLLSILLFSILALPTKADQIDAPLPALYVVVGVASDDQLNIRAQPDGSAAVIGSLAPDTQGIEVVALSRAGRWAQVNTAESTGWVALRYLRPDVVMRSPLGLPVGLQCFGTEPFWNMRFSDAPVLTLDTPETRTDHRITSLSPAPEFVDLTQTGLRFRWQGASATVTAHILPGTCSDGMSDRIYGLHYVDDQGPRKGCCSLN